MTCAVCSGLAAGVERFSFSMILPCSSTTPAATFVPPTSTPIVRPTGRPFGLPHRSLLLGPVIRGIRPRPGIRPRRGIRPRHGTGRRVAVRIGRTGTGLRAVTVTDAGAGAGISRLSDRGIGRLGRAGVRVGRRPAGTSAGRHDRLERIDGFPHDRRESVARAGEMRAEPGAGILHLARGPAERAPFALGRMLPALWLAGGASPHVIPAGIAVAEGLADIAAYLLAQAARAGPHQPPLEIADRVVTLLP